MSEPSQIATDRERFLQYFVATRFAELTAIAVERMRALPGRQSGGDSELADPFEEYASQLYGQHSVFMELYEREARSICFDIAKKLAPLEKQMLGAFSEGFLDAWVQEDDVAGIIANFDATECIERELHGRLQQGAMDWFEARDDDETEAPA